MQVFSILVVVLIRAERRLFFSGFGLLMSNWTIHATMPPLVSAYMPLVALGKQWYYTAKRHPLERGARGSLLFGNDHNKACVIASDARFSLLGFRRQFCMRRRLFPRFVKI